MKALTTLIFSAVVFLASVLIVLAISAPRAQASGRPQPAPAPDSQTGTAQIKKDKTVPVQAVVAVIVTIGTTGYCLYSRLFTDEPCIDFKEHKTTPDDDRVTPDNLRDTPQTAGVR